MISQRWALAHMKQVVIWQLKEVKWSLHGRNLKMQRPKAIDCSIIRSRDRGRPSTSQHSKLIKNPRPCSYPDTVCVKHHNCLIMEVSRMTLLILMRRSKHLSLNRWCRAQVPTCHAMPEVCRRKVDTATFQNSAQVLSASLLSKEALWIQALANIDLNEVVINQRWTSTNLRTLSRHHVRISSLEWQMHQAQAIICRRNNFQRCQKQRRIFHSNSLSASTQNKSVLAQMRQMCPGQENTNINPKPSSLRSKEDKTQAINLNQRGK